MKIQSQIKVAQLTNSNEFTPNDCHSSAQIKNLDDSDEIEIADLLKSQVNNLKPGKATTASPARCGSQKQAAHPTRAALCQSMPALVKNRIREEEMLNRIQTLKSQPKKYLQVDKSG